MYILIFHFVFDLSGHKINVLIFFLEKKSLHIFNIESNTTGSSLLNLPEPVEISMILVCSYW